MVSVISIAHAHYPLVVILAWCLAYQLAGFLQLPYSVGLPNQVRAAAKISAGDVGSSK